MKTGKHTKRKNKTNECKLKKNTTCIGSYRINTYRINKFLYEH